MNALTVIFRARASFFTMRFMLRGSVNVMGLAGSGDLVLAIAAYYPRI